MGGRGMNQDEARAATLRVIEGMADEIAATLAGLVRIPSVTPKYPGLVYARSSGGRSGATRR